MTTPPTAPGADTARPWRRRPSRWLRVLPAITLTAVLTITASTEFALARTVLALTPAIAWALPVAIDSYVLAALRSGRDVPAALTVMAGALTAAMGAHLAAPNGQPLPAGTRALAATAIMTALVVVAWRVHVLIEHQQDDAESTPPEAPSVVAGTQAAMASAPVSGEQEAAVPAEGVAGGGGVAAPAVPSAPGTARAAASTPTAAAAAARASTPRATATTAIDRPSPSTPSEIKPGLTDAQILADLVGASPGVRPLMRTYAIGQGRAARLHREATATAGNQPTEHPDPTRTTDETADQNTESDQQQPETKAQKGTSITSDRSEKHQNQESDREIQHDLDEESHPCITDRVGQSRSTDVDQEMPAAPSLSDFVQAGER